MHRRLAAAALAAALALPITAAPADARLAIPGIQLPQIPSVQRLIDDLLRHAPQLSSQVVPGSRLAPTQGPVAPQQQALIHATNRHRAQHGLHPLIPMPGLNGAAQDWAGTMAREDNLRHRPGFSSHFPAGWRMAAENVMMWSPPLNAEEIVAKFAASPRHNENMLRADATHIGVGIAVNRQGRQYTVQHFAGY